MRQDILRDELGDLLTQDGDFVIGESDQQHIMDIIDSQKGEFKEFPLVGFGAVNYLKTQTSEMEFKRDLKVQLQNDNYNDATIDLSGGYASLKIEI